MGRPGNKLRVARRSLEGLAGVVDAGEWEYFESHHRWSLKVTIEHAASTVVIPARSDWHFVVDEDYPFGDVTVYPDRGSGVATTFPHQRMYGLVSSDAPWGAGGNICASGQFQHFGRAVFTAEPWTAPGRLRWYAGRAVAWVEAAASGTLVAPGDPFERPAFDSTSKGPSFAFQENAPSFAAWQHSTVRSGLVELIRTPFTGPTLLIGRFLDRRGREVLNAPWPGRHFPTATETVLGVWIRLLDLPLLHEYQAPRTWEELKAVLKEQNIELLPTIKPMAERLRGGESFNLIIGYPVKDRVDDVWSQVQWQAATGPALTPVDTPVDEHGLHHELGRWLVDQRTVFADDAVINWRPTKNWDVQAITARGRLPTSLAEANVLLLGAGSLGSLLGEYLIRGGVRHLAVIDQDTLEIGNLVRHTLPLQAIGDPKSVALALHLNSVSSNTSAVALQGRFTPRDALSYQQYDLIVDSTGSDEIPYAMEAISWERPIGFVSVSVGVWAAQLYFYLRRAERFDADRLLRSVAPIVEADLATVSDEDFPREEVGCWNPVFPARVDDMSLMASVAVKELVRQLSQEGELEMLVVYRQEQKDGHFAGLTRAEHPIAPD